MKKEKWWEDWKADDVTPDMYILTKHSPKEHLSDAELCKIPAYFKPTSKEDLVTQFWTTLIGRGVAFKKTKNPIYAIETFVFAHKAGIYPPLWVLNCMAEIFNDWIKLKGTKSLDEVFELKPISGQAPLYKKDAEERRDEQLCIAVFVLQAFFGFTIDEGCHMVARRLEETDTWNKTPFDLKAISADTIKDRYKRKWRKIIKSLYDKKEINFPEVNQKEGKIAFLKQFPEDSFPVKKPLEQIIKKVV